MATVYGPNVTNIRADPPVKNSVAVLGARVRAACGTKALLSTNILISNVVVMERLPTNACILAIYLFADDLEGDGTSPLLTANVGVHTTAGVAKDADVYATLITTFQAASVAGSTNFAFEARNITKMGNTLWQDAGDSTAPDPGTYYDITLTWAASARNAEAGDISWMIVYTID